MATHLRRAVERVIGDLDQWVRERRDAGQGWREIAAAVSAESGIHVSHETVRQWVTQSDEDKRISA